jgi:formylglycine-generating enzyme required for sulfatase activity
MRFFVAISLIIISNNIWAFKDCDKCPEMVIIPSGEFMMGSEVVPTAYGDVFKNEIPQHKVSIKSFAIGKYEITQLQWRSLMGNNPSKVKGNNLPVEMISWIDSENFAKKLSEITGKKYRLPTESEWEYAARAGSTSIYPWGDNELELLDHAWFSPKINETRPVGLKRANAFGLYDMIGNVEEWTLDCEHKNYIGAPSDGKAWIGNGDCSIRMLRGGYWDDPSLNARTATRNSQNRKVKSQFIGFRIVREL